MVPTCAQIRNSVHINSWTQTLTYTQPPFSVFNARVLLCVWCVYMSLDGSCRGLAATPHRRFSKTTPTYLFSWWCRKKQRRIHIKLEGGRRKMKRGSLELSCLWNFYIKLYVVSEGHDMMVLSLFHEGNSSLTHNGTHELHVTWREDNWEDRRFISVQRIVLMILQHNLLWSCRFSHFGLIQVQPFCWNTLHCFCICERKWSLGLSSL